MEAGRQSAIPTRLFQGGNRLAASSHAYGVLLGLIVISLAFQLAAPDDGWARLVTVALQSGTLLIALRISGARPILVRVAAVLVVVALIGTTGVLVGTRDLGEEAGRGVGLMLAAHAPSAIAIGVIREIRAAGRVTLRAMFGVLCIYLLIGMLFAFAYGVIAALGDTPFFAQAAAETQSNFLYFSFTTQTTTGYGDLTAATGLGRALAITEALAGQIYLVTVVALMVSNFGRSRVAGRG
ncbi:MAG TPA: potassium channel family protein [Solirubrobacterales bacterium]|nr:potassium channel family protein [Solirubrobacterales bacterium]